MKYVLGFVAVMAMAAPASAQSLYLADGERAVEASAGWSFSPSSEGPETHVSVSLDGRWDVGVGFARYKIDFEDGSDLRFNTYSPFVKYFLVKQADGGAPVSLSLNAELYLDDYPSGSDKGKYVQVGAMVYKSLALGDNFALQPFIGFSFVAESYTFDGGDAETAQYLSRDLGLHFTTATDATSIWRLTLIEQSFSEDTYRGARVAYIRRF